MPTQPQSERNRRRVTLAEILVRSGLDKWKVLDAIEYPAVNCMAYINEKQGKDQEFKPADFFVFRYIWGAGNGKDLDTRTQLTDPSFGVVGWSRGTSISGTSGTYYTWGDDNLQDGVEAVLFDFNVIATDYPSRVVSGSLSAFWFSQAQDGNCSVQVESYLGGTMSQVGYDFVNTGGTLVQSETFYGLYLPTNAVGADIDGDLCATFTYDTDTKKLFFTRQR